MKNLFRKYSRRKPAINLVLTGVLLISAGYSQGPGIPQVTFPEEDLFTEISMIETLNGNGNNLGAMWDGFMMILHAPDHMAPGGGGFGFYDVSDPYNPILVSSTLPDPQLFVEVHGFGFSENVLAMQSHKGIVFFDISDIENPVQLKNLLLSDLPGNGYGGGNFATFWQAPYAYTASSNYGIHIVDAADPGNPIELKRVPKSSTGDFKVGHVYAVGNLLVTTTGGTEQDKVGISMLDISDPANPNMFFNTKSFPASYSMIINGEKIWASGNDGKVHVIDITDLTNIVVEASSEKLTDDPGEYVFIQDDYVFSGFNDIWVKLDKNTLELIGSGTLSHANGQEGHPQPYGNFIMVGNDHGTGSGLFPHDTEPDTKGPEANMVNPRDGAINQALTSRVGLTFTDQIDVPSVNSQTFIVRERGGPQLSGTYSSQQSIINFWPDEPLKVDTEYEVLIPAGGIKDWAGNTTELEFKSVFSTGNQITSVKDSKFAGPGAPPRDRKGLYGIYDMQGRLIDSESGNLPRGIYYQLDSRGNKQLKVSM